MKSTAVILAVFVALAVVAVSVAGPSQGIMCYICKTADNSDCDDPFGDLDKYRQSCGSGATTCLKNVTGSVIVRACNAPETANCTAAESDSGSTTQYCCAGNICNSAAIAGSSIMAAALTLIAAMMF